MAEFNKPHRWRNVTWQPTSPPFPQEFPIGEIFSDNGWRRQPVTVAIKAAAIVAGRQEAEIARQTRDKCNSVANMLYQEKVESCLRRIQSWTVFPEAAVSGNMLTLPERQGGYGSNNSCDPPIIRWVTGHATFLAGSPADLAALVEFLEKQEGGLNALSANTAARLSGIDYKSIGPGGGNEWWDRIPAHRESELAALVRAAKLTPKE